MRPASSSAARSCSRRRVIASRAENGSSISTIGRSSISVRASATRCRMPPDSVAGRSPRRSLEPDPVQQLAARGRAGAAARPRRAAQPVAQQHVVERASHGSSRSCCAIRRRGRRAGARRRRPLSAPRAASPAIRRSSVVLPTPEGPSRQVQLPPSSRKRRFSNSSHALELEAGGRTPIADPGRCHVRRGARAEIGLGRDPGPAAVRGSVSR